jgi:nicotinamide mononucleotide (NMN) deamidase PncC
MSDNWRELIERIHAASPPVVLAVTGGGASAISELLGVPGGSRMMLEAVVPYSEQALVEWLGKAPGHFCVEETALAMATVAYRRAGELAAKNEAIGVACTASLASDRPKKGAHRCHIATQTRSASASYSLVLEKGARDRTGEERLVGRVILLALARAAGLADLLALELRPGESVVEHLATADPLLIELLEGQRHVVWSLPDIAVKSSADAQNSETPNAEPGSACGSSLHQAIPIPLSPPCGILCGSFHPLHFGHRQLREVAETILKGPVYYEMSIRNVDKPPLDFLSIARRRAQFTEVPLALTAAPTFVEKAAALPGVVFVVGVDTAERIVHCKYYGGSLDATRAALERIRNAGCRFLVACRQFGERFETLSDVVIASDFASMFDAIPEGEFRADVSSTQLRKSASD